MASVLICSFIVVLLLQYGHDGLVFMIYLALEYIYPVMIAFLSLRIYGLRHFIY